MAQKIKTYLSKSDRNWKFCFYCSFFMSIALIVLSFFIPPVGIIDSSVFVAVGELFAFPALFAIYNMVKSGKMATLKHGNTEITIGEDDNETNTTL